MSLNSKNQRVLPPIQILRRSLFMTHEKKNQRVKNTQTRTILQLIKTRKVKRKGTRKRGRPRL